MIKRILPINLFILTCLLLGRTAFAQNTAPIAVHDFFSTTNGIAINCQVISNDYDPDALQTITIQGSLLLYPKHGSIGSINSPNGFISYTPFSGYCGKDSFIYQICDNGTPTLCDTAKVIITMTGIVPPSPTSITVNGLSGTIFTPCKSSDVIINAVSSVGCTIHWGGPNGFYSNQSKDTIIAVGPAQSGNYYVYQTNSSGCNSAQTLVNINPVSCCPPNIDYEYGNFTNWKCFTGTYASNVYTLTASAPTLTQHTIIPTGFPGASITNPTPVAGNDPYGNFPVKCPTSLGGGGFSARLGNDLTNYGAERMIYYIRIPPGANTYNLIYNYAVVFEDPGHTASQQPGFMVRVFDSIAGPSVTVPCASFTFIASSSLPGFSASTTSGVFYKPWSQASLALNNLGGKTIALEFSTHDCGLGAHFGYAYVDINLGCGISAIVQGFCPGATSATLTGPPGFQYYYWYNSTVNTLLGTGQSYTMTPAPTSPVTLALAVFPYSGYGCPDTLYTLITIPPKPTSNFFAPQKYCKGSVLQFYDSSFTSTPGSYLNYWSWNFGDPYSSTSNPNTALNIQNPTHIYTQLGTYTACLIVKSNIGCSSDTFCKTIIINKLPTKPPLALSASTLCSFNDTLTISYPGPVKNGFTYNFKLDTCFSIISGSLVNVGTCPPLKVKYNCKGTKHIQFTIIPPPGDTNCIAFLDTTILVGGPRPIISINGEDSICRYNAFGQLIKDTLTIKGLAPVYCGAATSNCNSPTNYVCGTNNGSTSNAPTPFYGLWTESKSQILLLASELVAKGFTAGTISGLSFNVLSKGSSAPSCNANGQYAGFTIKMACVSYNSINNGSTTSLDLSTPLTQVFTTSTYNTTLGINTFNFQTPYNWDGVSNLLIQTCYDAGSSCYTGYDRVAKSTIASIATATGIPATSKLCTYAYSDIANGCGNNYGNGNNANVTVVTTATERPDITLKACVSGAITPTTTFSWTSSPSGFISTSNPIIVSPSVTTTYTVTATNNGCSTSKSFIVNQLQLNKINAGKDTSKCGSTPVTLSATVTGPITSTPGMIAYQWTSIPASSITNSTSASINVSPTSTTTYVVKLNGAFCPVFDTVVVTVATPPTITVNSPSICKGLSTTLTANGANTYSWSPSTGLSATTGTSVTANPTTTTTYTITGTAVNGCLNTATAVVTVLPLPTVTVNSPSICNGTSATLTANGANTYTWSPSTGLSATTGASVSANPITTTTYTITGTAANGCLNTATATVTVLPLPTITVNSASICNGASAALTANGANTYTWSPSTGLSATTGASVTANPTTTTTYTITGTAANGCLNTATSVVTVLSLPTVTVNSPSICNGASATLTANGANTYTWSPSTGLSATTGASVTANPTTTTTYTITGTAANGCLNTATAVVTVLPLPTVTVNSPSICNGALATLIANGANTYSWSPSTGLSATTGASVTSNPTTTTTYTITGTAVNGCLNTATATVTVLPLPTITVNSASICNGASATLTASGANTYTWSPSTGLSATTGASVTANPTTTTTYTITGTAANGCLNTATATVTVLPLPTVTVNSPSICNGASTTLTANGANTYSWSPSTGLSATTGASVTANPTTTTTYTITGTAANGCLNTATATVTVLPLPTVSVNSPSICNGASTTLTASGANTYTWSPSTGLSATTGASVTANPTTTTTYTITGTAANGCLNTATATVTVLPLPTITVNSPSICMGLITTLTANGANTYSWSPSTGLSATTGASVTANPTTTTTYTITGTAANGCLNTATATVTVLPLPTITVNSPSICNGASTTLTASGANTYSWSPSTGLSATTGASVTANPTTTTTYTITGTISSGCLNTATAIVTVLPLPTISVNSLSICNGASTTLTASGANTYSWSPSTGLSATTGVSVTANPTTTTTYTITGTAVNSCLNTTTAVVTVNNLPIIHVNDTAVCFGNQATLHASGAISYNWTPSTILNTTIGSNVIASTNTSTQVIVTGTDLNGCSNTDTADIIINSLPILSSNNDTICFGQSTTIIANGANTYTWWPNTNLNTSNGNTVIANPISTITYSIVGTDLNNCTDSTHILIIVNPLPQLSVNTDTICYGQSTQLIAQGASTYIWHPQTGLASTSYDTAFINTLSSQTYTVTGITALGCMDSITTTVMVNPLPTPQISFTPATICITAPIQNPIYSPLGGTMYGAGILNNQFNPSVAGLGQFTIHYIVTDNNSCTDSTTALLTVVNLPAVQINTNPDTLCKQGNPISLSGTPAGGTFNGPAISGNQFNPLSGNLGLNQFTYTYTDPLGCSNSTNDTITLINGPSISFQTIDSICITGGLVTLAATPTGGTFSGNGVLGTTFDPQLVGIGLHTIYYTVSNYLGCVNMDSMQIRVLPLPAINFNGNTTQLCVDASTINLLASPAGGTFSGAGVLGNTFTPNTSLIGNNTIYYSVTDINGCNNIDSFIITVNPLPNVSWNALIDSVCLNGASISLSGTPFGGTFTGAGISGNQFNPYNAGLGWHTLYYNYTDNKGCSNVDSTVIYVKALPIVQFSTNNSNVCIDGPNITLQASPSGGIFTGTGVSANVFSPSLAGVGTHSIIYTFTDQQGCTGYDTIQINVHALPIITWNNPPSQLCFNANSFTLAPLPVGGILSGSGINGYQFIPSTATIGNNYITYQYTDGWGCSSLDSISIQVLALPSISLTAPNLNPCTNTTPIAINALPSGGSYTATAGLVNAVFTPSISLIGPHDIIYTYTDANGCTNKDTLTITVHALPTPSLTVPANLCINASPVNIISNPIGGTLTGNGLSGSSFNPSLAGIGTTIFNYTFTDIYGCSAIATANTNVVGLPNVNFTVNPTIFCTSSPSVTLSGTPTGGTFSGFGISGSTFNPSNAGTGNIMLYYQFTNANGCSNFDSFQVHVAPTPNVQISPIPSTICINAAAINLSATPLGGTWSGAGVSAQTFNPSLAGLGNHKIYYTVTNANACTDKDSVSITVLGLPSPQIVGLPTSICIAANTFTVNLNPTGGILSGPGLTAGYSFTAALAGLGTQILNYTYTNSNGCVGTTADTITVVNMPTANFSIAPDSVCINSNAINLIGSPAGGIFTGIGVTANNFNPTTAGNQIITYTYTDNFACQAIVKDTIYVSPLPSISFNNPSNVCVTANAFPLNALPQGGIFSGNGVNVNASMFIPSQAGPGLHTIYYSYTNTLGCVNTDSFQINVHALPTTIFNYTGGALCPYQTAFTLSATPLGGAFIGNGISATNLFTPANASIGTNIITYTFTDVNGCTNSDTSVITILPIPVINLAGNPSDLCVNANTITLQASPAGGTWSGFVLNGNQFNPSQAGIFTHTLIYTYANQCTNKDTIQITVHALPIIQLTSTSTKLCENASPVTLQATPTGGSWSGASTNGSFTPSASTIGTNTIYYQYTDNFACVSQDSIQLTVYTIPTIAFTIPSPVCNSSNSIPLQATPSGGLWSGAFVNANYFLPANAPTGNNKIYYTYQNPNLANCGAKDSTFINVLQGPVNQITPSNLKGCGPLVLSTTNTSLYTSSYNWNFGDGNSSSIAAPQHLYSDTGVHMLIYIGANAAGCQDTTYIPVHVFPNPIAAISLPNQGCGIPNNTNAFNLSQGYSNFTWYWENQTSQNNPLNLSYPNYGTYAIQLICQNVYGCADTANKNYTVYPKPNANFSFKNINLPIGEASYNFINLSSGALTYIWDFGDGSTANTFTPSHTYTNYGDYTITLIVINAQGCSDTAQQTLHFYYENGLFVPNSFMPLGDNPDKATFQPIGKGLASYHIWIYDTWGTLLWESTLLDNEGAPKESWNGCPMERPGEILPQDVYVWKIEATFLDGKTWQGNSLTNEKPSKVGTLTLIR